jgi:hypothetical protein
MGEDSGENPPIGFFLTMTIAVVVSSPSVEGMEWGGLKRATIVAAALLTTWEGASTGSTG